VKKVTEPKNLDEDSELREGNERRHQKVTRMGKQSFTEKSHCTAALKPTSLNDRKQISSLFKPRHRTRATTDFALSCRAFYGGKPAERAPLSDSQTERAFR